MASCDLCSSGNCLCCRFCLTSDFLSHIGRPILPADGEDFQADIVTSSVHSSPYSASTPPARRIMASRPGEMPTTPVGGGFPCSAVPSGCSRLAPDLAWECGEREEVVAGLVKMGHDLEGG